MGSPTSSHRDQPKPRPSSGREDTIEVRWLETGAGKRCAEVLAQLPEWFGIPEANESYRQAADANPTAVAFDGDVTAGLLTLTRHSPYAAEIHLIAVPPERHRAGIGRQLVTEAERRLRGEGIEYLQVKTLSSRATNEPYARTRRFYEAMGFRALEEMPLLWDESNPALILVKRL